MIQLKGRELSRIRENFVLMRISHVAVICRIILCTLIIAFFIHPGAAAADVCDIQAPCTETPALVASSSSESVIPSICVYHFYGNGCPHCARIQPFIDEMSAKYPRIQVKSFEIYFNASNQVLYRDFVARYEAKSDGIPAVFISDKALIGENVIRDNLEEEILYTLSHESVCPETYSAREGTPHDISPGAAIDLTIPAVISAALVDSINPCAFAVLIFLLTYLISLKERRRVLIAGLIYISAVFVVYFFSGLGLFALVQQAGIAAVVATIAAVIAIIAGIINVIDAARDKATPTLSIPASQKARIQDYVAQATLPAAFLLGALVSIVELPCTGGVYLAILGMLSSTMTLNAGLPYLLLYNAIFVAPLLVILLVVYAGVSADTLETMRLGGRRWMRGMIGMFLIMLGILMLSGIL
jgi:cytochrome c biogenesis protein CcdA/thiol-disulfide isomerase/thioredoxin